MNAEDLARKRKIAKERITEQFADVLQETGAVLVDCGAELGHAYVSKDKEYGWFNVQWLGQSQVRTLSGRIFKNGAATVRPDYAEWLMSHRDQTPRGEVDFGVNWTADGQSWPRWRLSWVRATGELYAKEQRTPDRGRFAILGVFKTREEVESALAEWADSPMTLEWVWERTSSTLTEETGPAVPASARACPDADGGEHNPTFERVDDDEMMVVSCFECGVEGRIKLRDVFAQYPIMWEEN